MRVATWNVNSIRSRLQHLTSWLGRASPDVICLQETKVEDDRFPCDALRECGYEPVFFGERTYNGVCIAARFGFAIEDVKKNLDGDGDASSKRAIAATVEGVRIVNVYAPNGQAVGTQAWHAKLAWFERLRAELEARYAPDQELLVCGDFNVAPAPIDVYDPEGWEHTVLFHRDGRAALERVLAWGLVDAYRAQHPDPGQYTWWDYRMGNFRKNKGLRIDLALVTRPLAARLVRVEIDRRPREEERPSDHAPVVVEIA